MPKHESDADERKFSVGYGVLDRFVSFYNGVCRCGSGTDTVKMVISEDDVDPVASVSHNVHTKAVVGDVETKTACYEIRFFNDLTGMQQRHVLMELVEAVIELSGIIRNWHEDASDSPELRRDSEGKLLRHRYGSVELGTYNPISVRVAGERGKDSDDE